ncbi:hypothetical protein G6F46_015705 [Rhizopus delemar]|nr:hypothetical protein G6F46_015705 [Rhizopus delemar]
MVLSDGCTASNRRWPSSVSDISRVVRCRRRTPSCFSSVFRLCDSAGRETPISSAALVKLRWWAMWANQASCGSRAGLIAVGALMGARSGATPVAFW